MWVCSQVIDFYKHLQEMKRWRKKKSKGYHIWRNNASCEIFLNGKRGGGLKTKAWENSIRSQDPQRALGYGADSGPSVLRVELLWVYGPRAGNGPPALLCLQGKSGGKSLPSIIKAENRRQDCQMARAQKRDQVIRLLRETWYLKFIFALQLWGFKWEQIWKEPIL